MSDVGGAIGSVAMVASVHGSGSVATGGVTVTVGAATPVAKSTKPWCDAPWASAPTGGVAMSAAEKGALHLSMRAARTCKACGSTFKSPQFVKTHKCTAGGAI